MFFMNVLVANKNHHTQCHCLKKKETKVAFDTNKAFTISHIVKSVDR